MRAHTRFALYSTLQARNFLKTHRNNTCILTSLFVGDFFVSKLHFFLQLPFCVGFALHFTYILFFMIYDWLLIGVVVADSVVTLSVFTVVVFRFAFLVSKKLKDDIPVSDLSYLSLSQNKNYGPLLKGESRILIRNWKTWDTFIFCMIVEKINVVILFL